MSVSNGQLANASTFNSAFVSKTADSTVTGTITQNKESVIAEITTPSTPASGYGKVYFKSDGKLYQLNDSGIETQVGSGAAGSSGTNFITNGSAEDNNITGWAVYADAAGTSPVDGTGGTANVTNSTSAVSPIFGTYSFLLAKDAVNRQGQGWSYHFTIDSGYKAKVLQISFDYLVSSGTFNAGTTSADSDVTVWIYDVTNAVIIQPSSYKLFSNSSSISAKHSATFQTASNSTSYRLIFHVGSTNASAYTLKVDGVSVSPSAYVYGSPVTDWTTATVGNIVGSTSGTLAIGTGGGATYTAEYRRLGNDAEVRYTLRIGTAGTADVSGAYIFPYPTGISTSLANYSVIGYGDVTVVGTAFPVARLIAKAYTGGFILDSTDAALLANPSGLLFNNANQVNIVIKFKVAGWSSSLQVSNDADTRIVAAYITKNSLAPQSTSTPYNFGSAAVDTHGAWNGTTTYTIPVSGWYRISGQLQFSITATAGQYFNLAIATNGTAGDTQTKRANGTAMVTDCFLFSPVVRYFNSGNQITLINTGTNYSSITASTDASWISIERISGPSAIAATETVAAIYNTAAGQSIPYNVETVVVLGTKVYDSHSAMNASTGVYTCPISGEYEISGGFYFSTAITATATDVQFLGYKNGSAYLANNVPKSGTAACPLTTSGTMKIRCNAGDTLSIALRQNNTALSAQTLLTNGAFNWGSFTRIGN